MTTELPAAGTAAGRARGEDARALAAGGRVQWFAVGALSALAAGR